MAQRSMETLLIDIQFALDRGMGARDLVPMLSQLRSLAPAGSDVSRFARLELARQILEEDPFRAAGLARSVSAEQEDDQALGVLGLALTLMGCFRAASAAHRRACHIAPEHPGHAHNLGHLLDVALERPGEAIPWLERAFCLAPDVRGIASSYAHALVRVGRIEDARSMLRRHARLDEESTEATMAQWLTPPELTRDAS